tara:strand:- start:23506 stop:24318 length:813 start_codon:yes stop_codon:yes gene_type:complete
MYFFALDKDHFACLTRPRALIMASRPITTVERTYVSFYVADVNGLEGHDQVVLKHPNGLCVVCLAHNHPMCAAARDDESGGRETVGSDDGPSTTGKRKREDGGDGGDAFGAVNHDKRNAPTQTETTTTPSVSKADADEPSSEPSNTEKKTITSCAKLALVDFSCGKGSDKNSVVMIGKKKRGAKVLMEHSGIARLVDSNGKEWTARACVRGKLLETNERLSQHPNLATADCLGAGFLCILEPRPEDLEKLKKKALTLEEYNVVLEKRKQS